MQFKVPFKGRSHYYTEDEIQVVVDVMKSKENLTQGRHLKEFEKKFGQTIGAQYCYGVMNATAALELAAALCQFKDGEELIIPSHTYTSSAYPFFKKGARIRWADIDLNTFVVSEKQIEPLITKKTKAILVPHLYGYVANMKEIRKLADAYGILVIEDAAQVVGCRIGDQYAGTFGHMSVFSFHSHKNITTLGEGGMLVVQDPEMAAVVPMMRHNGHCAFDFEREDYWIPAMGNVDVPVLNNAALEVNNYCIGEAESALGAKMLDRMDEVNQQKRERAIHFIGELKKYSNLKFLEEDSCRHNYHLLVARETSGRRNEFIRTMARDFSIQCIAQYYPLNRYDYYKKNSLGQAHLPNTNEFYDNMISFPFHHCIEETDLEYVLDSAKKTLDKVSQLVVNAEF